jgi:hypothetical protein
LDPTAKIWSNTLVKGGESKCLRAEGYLWDPLFDAGGAANKKKEVGVKGLWR